jgi:hypothetical protein
MSGPAERGTPYEIVVKGEIGRQFSVAFEGMELRRARGRTILEGKVIDQAQLHGLIERIQDMGLELVSVNPIPPPLAGGGGPEGPRGSQPK